MNIYLISIVTVLYLTIGIGYFFQGNWPMGITWSAYATANIGLLCADLLYFK